ncbi:MAG: hypothetical protein ACI8PZ_007546 [Myxococcota bacterium]
MRSGSWPKLSPTAADLDGDGRVEGWVSSRRNGRDDTHRPRGLER